MICIPRACATFALALAAALLAERRYTSFCLSLLFLNVFLFLIVNLDYRLRANQFYMLFWLNIVYLFSPSKRVSIPLVIISFYIWAGILKLNYEWLSGSVLYDDLWLIPRRFAQAACAYVVVLELVFIWGLRSSKAFIFYAVLVQLAAFHIQSLSQIHWFYPLLMATILSWFFIERQQNKSHASTSKSVASRGRAWGYVAPTVFAGLQLLPYAYAGNPDLTGRGRVFALHMFAGKPVCEVTATIRWSTGTTSTVDLELHSFPPRMICDPVVYFSRAKNLCRERARLGVEDFDLVMRSRRTTDTNLVTITHQPSFCGGNFSYSVYGRNDWMSDPHAPQRAVASVGTR